MRGYSIGYLLRPPSTAYRLRKTASRHRVALTVTVIVAVTLLVAAATSIWFAVEKNRSFTKVEAQRQTIAKLYFRQILESVMSGNKMKAERAIQEVEDQEVLDPAKIEYLRGIGHWLAMGLIDDEQEKNQQLLEAQNIAENLRELPDTPIAVYTRAGFYCQVDDMKSLSEIEDELSEYDSVSTCCIAVAKYRHHDYVGAAGQLSQAQGSADLFLLMGRAFAVVFTDDSDAEIQAIYSRLKDLPSQKWWFRDYVLLMQSNAVFRQQQCVARIEAGNLSDWDENLLSK